MTAPIDGVINPPCPCPSCGYTGAKGTSKEEDRGPAPKAGDIGVCMRCADVVEFNKDMSLKVATLTTLMKMSQAQHEAVSLLQEKIRRERMIE